MLFNVALAAKFDMISFSFVRSVSWRICRQIDGYRSWRSDLHLAKVEVVCSQAVQQPLCQSPLLFFCYYFSNDWNLKKGREERRGSKVLMTAGGGSCGIVDVSSSSRHSHGGSNNDIQLLKETVTV